MLLCCWVSVLRAPLDSSATLSRPTSYSIEYCFQEYIWGSSLHVLLAYFKVCDAQIHIRSSIINLNLYRLNRLSAYCAWNEFKLSPLNQEHAKLLLQICFIECEDLDMFSIIYIFTALIFAIRTSNCFLKNIYHFDVKGIK